MGDRAIAIANDLTSCVPVTPVQLLKTSTAGAAPVPLTANRTYFRQAIIIGKKALDGTDNDDAVAIGFSSASSEQPIVLQPGATYVLEPPNGVKWNFQDIYLDVAADDDGVVILYC